MGLPESLQKVKPVGQVVAVDDDRIELTLRQQIRGGQDLRANLDVDRELLQCRTQHSEQSSVPADEKRVQIHSTFDTSG